MYPTKRKLKIPFEKVVSSFKREGYTVLLDADSFVNVSKTPIPYMCPKGHNGIIEWKNWNSGHRCKFCAGRKLYPPTIFENMEKYGYTVLSREEDIIDIHSLIEFKCPNGHYHKISTDNWKRGIRCPYCVKKKIDFNDIKLSFEGDGYELLITENEYINARTPIPYVCERGHRGSIRWDNWRQGKRCSECASIEFSIKYSGENSWAWKGGKSYDDYCPAWTDKEFKKFIKERDGHVCQNPGCWGTTDRLCIHHIDYNKHNCSPDNLITLCFSCNSRANVNREFHKSYYQDVVNR